jgi:predicted Ser/Thr protein kinase
MVKCPACSHQTAVGARFCPQCAAALDGSFAETAFMPAAGSQSPRSEPMLSSSTCVDEGRFLPGVVMAGRYRIAGLLGRGGMGEVYRATDLTLGQAVALKFLPEAASSDDRALARFYNEVRMARQVTHPNVCRVYDIGQVDGQHYISMEYVDGENLAALMRRIGRLPADKAVEIARKLCAGLAAAHEKGVLHRDLKPANVMIDGRGNVVIMDFGLAGLTAQLQADVRSGTPAYMAPEQLAGTEVTAKSDLYSLGLVIYELFTGKRAYEASSMMELMEMQERAAPASISTVVKDLEPGVERVIMRCLDHDPRKRPASALAIAAGLGGDALAAALAAGEMPSPEVVAAAGDTEGLQPRVAVAWLAATLVGIVVVGILGAKYCLLNDVPLDNPPDALASDARALIKGFGYTAKPADSSWGLAYNSGYQTYLKQHPQRAAVRWKNPNKGMPPLIRFWYLQSPYAMVAEQHFSTVLAYSDPPLLNSGMVRVRTDPDGHLVQFEAVPPQVEPPAPAPAAQFDWNTLFRAAGLNPAQYQPAEPTWTPLANWDSRAAWTGTDAASGSNIRVEATAWRGKPVSFRVIGPWTRPERMQAAESGQDGTQIGVLVVIYLALTGACFIAWHNIRTGKGDRRGASTFAWIYFICMAAARMLDAHHTPSLEELNVFWKSISVAALNAGAIWVFYIALEPWVRRRWPHTMISWSRYVSKGIRDPLVGRDILLGAGFGCLVALIEAVTIAAHGQGVEPLTPVLQPLMGLRPTIAAALDTFTGSFFDPVILLFLLFVLRVILRKQWLAAVVCVLLVTVVFKSSGIINPWIDVPAILIIGALNIGVLLRYGMLALIVVDVISEYLLGLPRTFDFSAWYAGIGLAPLVAVALVAIFGFRTSLAGRPVLREDLL